MKARNAIQLWHPLLVLLVLTVSVLLSACAAHPARSSAVTDGPSVPRISSHDEKSDEPETGHASLRGKVQAQSFAQWEAEFRLRALANGISQATVDATFANVRLVPGVLKLDSRQPEFSRRIWSYLDILVSQARVRIGRQKLRMYADTAVHTEERYGVPREIIGAIWGIESSYGGNFGNYDTVAALATLAFEGRRRDWAVKQLYAIFKIIDRGLIDRRALRGSWAGAMGHTQFLPSSYLAYGIDGDGDGHIDIWSSIPDVMASTANYLVAHEWQSGSHWGVEVTLPPDFNYGQARLSITHSTRFWRRQGVARSHGAPPLPEYAEASVLTPAGVYGPAFLVGPNFRVIMTYNHAISYALAVGLLADRLAGRPDVQIDWPRGLEPLSHDQVLALQRVLNRGGFDAGMPDGIIGPNTKAGIRAFQRARGLAADGFATRTLLQRIRHAVGRL